jgi:hypothetical protein
VLSPPPIPPPIPPPLVFSPMVPVQPLGSTPMAPKRSVPSAILRTCSSCFVVRFMKKTPCVGGLKRCRRADDTRLGEFAVRDERAGQSFVLRFNQGQQIETHGVELKSPWFHGFSRKKVMFDPSKAAWRMFRLKKLSCRTDHSDALRWLLLQIPYAQNFLKLKADFTNDLYGSER